MKKQQMVGDFIVIGGGGFGATSSQGVIEQYIMDQSKKVKPRICFLPTASGENQAYIQAYYEACGRLHCDPSHVLFFDRTPDVKSALLSSDIIYVGGGNTKSMLGVFKAWGVDQLLREAHQSGILMAGVSAGMICWFQRGITDSWSSSYHVMDCMGLLPGCACPHYDSEDGRRPLVHDLVRRQVIDRCQAVEDGAALHYRHNELLYSLSFQENKNAYTIYQEGGVIVESPHEMMSL